MCRSLSNPTAASATSAAKGRFLSCHRFEFQKSGFDLEIRGRVCNFAHGVKGKVVCIQYINSTYFSNYQTIEMIPPLLYE